MIDNTVRRVLKRIARAWVEANLVSARVLLRVRGRAPFLLGGDCRRCAACCESPGIRVGWVTWYFPTLRRAFLAWQRHLNGFRLIESDFRTRVLTFECTHFDRTTRTCDSYDSRPSMCRDYPRLLLYQPHPELLPSCGYRPIARDAKRFLHVLQQQSLSDEQRERLKKKLFLE